MSLWGLFGGNKKTTKPKGTIQVPPAEDQKKPEIPVTVQNQEPAPVIESKPPAQTQGNNEMFGGMNMSTNTSQPKQDPNAYNPPNLFAGLNMSSSMNSGPSPASDTSTGITIKQGSGSSVFGSQPQGVSQPQAQNATLNFGPNQVIPPTPQPISLSGTQPGAQPGAQPGGQPMGVFSSDPNSIFFGMQPNKSFENNNSSVEAINTSTDLPQTTIEQTVEKDVKEDHSNTADDSSKEFANISRISQNEPSDTYNPPNLFENLNVSSPAPPVKEEKTKLVEKPPVEKVTPKKEGFWNSYKKKTPTQETPKKGKESPKSIPDFVVKEEKVQTPAKSESDRSREEQKKNKHDTSEKEAEIERHIYSSEEEEDDFTLEQPPETMVNFVKSLSVNKKFKNYHEQTIDALEKQMQKWRSLKEKRDEEKKLQQRIKDNEEKLDEASRAEDFDTAEEIQKQIDKDMQKIQSITRLMLDLDKQRFELEKKLAKIKEEEELEHSRNIEKLIELESKHRMEVNIFEKTEEQNISDIKKGIRSKEIRIQETGKDLDKKLEETQRKLEEFNEKCKENAREHIEERDGIEQEIQQIDQEIEELERKLKEKRDAKAALETKRASTLKEIRKANEEYEADIDYLEETLEKYNNKITKNNNKQAKLDDQKKELEEKEKQVQIKLEEYQEKIDKINEHIENTKKRVSKREKFKSKKKKIINYYEDKQEEFRDIVTRLEKIDLKELEEEVQVLEEGLDNSISKLSDLEAAIDQLNSDKKTLAQKKKFKEAKRVKETLELKIKDQEMTKKWMEEATITKEKAEEKMVKAKKTLKKLAAKKLNEEEELREYEFRILLVKKKELQHTLEEAEGVKGYEDIFKILDKEIKDMQERYGFTSTEDSDNEEEEKSESEKEKSDLDSSIASEKTPEKTSEKDEEEKVQSESEEEPEDKPEFDFTSMSKEELNAEKDNLATLVNDLEEKMNTAAEEDDFDEAERLEEEQSKCAKKLQALEEFLKNYQDDVEETSDKQGTPEEENQEEPDQVDKEQVNEEQEESKIENVGDLENKDDEERSQKSKGDSRPEKSQDSNDDQVEMSIVKNISEAEETAQTNSTPNSIEQKEFEEDEKEGEKSKEDEKSKEEEKSKEVEKVKEEAQVNEPTTQAQPAAMSLDMFEIGMQNTPPVSSETPSDNKEEPEEEYTPPVLPM
ncbi:unnamed protein product [Moneuplotes crassus]|uniref:Uncharacterized protein n=2 Tax=Euplotes crassus TaxID=5936 RepID=A0AAD1UDF9_EUPCR|nr:unnamed protein product [Moneuplotes crassus]